MKSLCINGLFTLINDDLADHLVERDILFAYKGHLYFSPSAEGVERLTHTLITGAYHGYQRTAEVQREEP